MTAGGPATPATPASPVAAIEAVWRIEAGRLVAALARITGDFSAAEDLAQDALEIALRQWPVDGIPDRPAGWLMATAKHVAVDRHRRQQTYHRKLAVLARDDRGESQQGDPMAVVDEALDADAIKGDDDDLLRLIFTACHPALTVDSQVALVLRTLGGLQTGEIARAFLVPETTMGQRISRAKKTLTDRRVEFTLPPTDELPSRLDAVLGVVYLIFNEGYSASAGDDWLRPALCSDALRLGRLLVTLQPEQPEVHGLLSLMELQASRFAARTGTTGEPVLLADQDRRRWDRASIRRGLAALGRAEELSATSGWGAYTLQAAIASCHARADSVAETDWPRIAALYTVLAHVAPSPVVALNRAVAVGRAEGPAAGLALVDRLRYEPSLVRYPPLYAVRGTLLAELGRTEEARAEFARAADLTDNAAERRLYAAQAGSE